MVRMPVVLVSLALLVPPSAASAQEATILDVVSGLLDWLELQDDYSLVPEYGQWGLLIGWFGEGEAKETRFEVEAGQDYYLAGEGDANVEDLDICVYNELGSEVECDRLTDAIPLVSFTARSSGTYRAVLTAYDLDAATGYAGMILLRR